MSEDINLLPSEMRPKKKEAKRKPKPEVELSAIRREAPVLPQEPAKKTKGGLFSKLSFGKPTRSRSIAGLGGKDKGEKDRDKARDLDISGAREDLLQQIKKQDMGEEKKIEPEMPQPVSPEPQPVSPAQKEQEEPQPRPSRGAGRGRQSLWSKFLAWRERRKEAKREKHENTKTRQPKAGPPRAEKHEDKEKKKREKEERKAEKRRKKEEKKKQKMAEKFRKKEEEKKQKNIKTQEHPVKPAVARPPDRVSGTGVAVNGAGENTKTLEHPEGEHPEVQQVDYGARVPYGAGEDTKTFPPKADPAVLQGKPEKSEAPEKVKESTPVALKSGNILETNLMKGQRLLFVDWKRYIRSLVISVMLCIFIIGAIYGWLIWEEARLKSLGLISTVKQELQQKQQEVNELEQEAQELADLRVKIKEVKKLLAQHIYWTNLFNYLEDNTLPGVYYEDFDGDLSGEYSLTATADNFDAFIGQIDTWQKESEYTKSITIEGGEMGSKDSTGQTGGTSGKGISFDIELEVDADIFYRE